MLDLCLELYVFLCVIWFHIDKASEKKIDIFDFR